MRGAIIDSKISDELVAAEGKFPGWPKDIIHAAAIVAEECGELVKAAVDFHFGRGSREAVEREAVQTGAMAYRFLMHVEDYPVMVKPKTKYIRKKGKLHMNKGQPETCGECVHFEGNDQENYCPFKMTTTEAESGGCGEGELK